MRITQEAVEIRGTGSEAERILRAPDKTRRDELSEELVNDLRLAASLAAHKSDEAPSTPVDPTD